MPTRTRAALVAALALVASAVLAGTASATTTSPGSVMNQQVDNMSTGTALLIFAGIPLCVVALVWLLVSAPGWTRGGRPSDTDAWTGDAVVVGASAPAAALTADGAEAGEAAADEATGGSSAAW